MLQQPYLKKNLKLLRRDVLELDELYSRLWKYSLQVLSSIDHATLLRRAAYLWVHKKRLWYAIRDSWLPHNQTVAIIDSFPLSICHFAVAYRYSCLKGKVRYREDHTTH